MAYRILAKNKISQNQSMGPNPGVVVFNHRAFVIVSPDGCIGPNVVQQCQVFSDLRSFYSTEKLSRREEGEPIFLLEARLWCWNIRRTDFPTCWNEEWCSRTIGHSVIRQSILSLLNLVISWVLELWFGWWLMLNHLFVGTRCRWIGDLSVAFNRIFEIPVLPIVFHYRWWGCRILQIWWWLRSKRKFWLFALWWKLRLSLLPTY